MLIIGHRGASSEFPENTASAFLGAREQGADWVELDVRLTAQDVLIVHHDAWYRDERTVWATPVTEVPEGVIELAAALDACAGLGVNIEIKNTPGDLGPEEVPYRLEVVDAVLELLAARAAAGTQEEVLVSSFDLPTIDRVKELRPDVATGYLAFDLNAYPDSLRRAVDGGHDAFHPWDPFVTRTLVDECHGLGLRLNTWTVDEPDRIRELGAWGVDGVVTNVPAVAGRALGRPVS